MKSEERHQLEQNDLISWISKIGQTIKPYLRIGGIACGALLLAFVGSRYYASVTRQSQNEAWNAFFAANEPKNFEAVAVEYAGTEVASFAWLRVADYTFEQGKNLLASDQAAALEKLNLAGYIYWALAPDPETKPQSTPNQVPIVEESKSIEVTKQAAFGAALAIECKGKLTQAKAAYESVIQRFPDTIVAENAAMRLKKIETPEAQAFYAQLAAYDPKLPTNPESLTLPPNSMEDDDFVPLPPNLKSDPKKAEAEDSTKAIPKSEAKPESEEKPKSEPETKPAPSPNEASTPDAEKSSKPVNEPEKPDEPTKNEDSADDAASADEPKEDSLKSE